MAIVSCPECGKKLKIADTSVGKKVKGPCGHVFVAEGDAAAAPMPAALATPEKVYVACTECGAKLKVATTSLGKKMKCPKCAAVFVAKLPEDEPAAAPIEKAKPAVSDDDMDDLLSFAQADAKNGTSAAQDEDQFKDEPVKSRAQRKLDEEAKADSDDDDRVKPGAAKAKGKARPKPAEDDDDDAAPKGKQPPRMSKDAAAPPVYPSRLLPNILVTLMVLAFGGLVGAIFFDVNIARLLDLPEAKGVRLKPKLQDNAGSENEKKAKEADEANKKDMALLAGTWIVESPDELKGKKFVFADGKVTTPDGDGAFSLDTNHKPKWISLPAARMQLLGIYELEGDVLKWCLAAPTKKTVGKGKEISLSGARPKHFDPAEGTVVVLSREKKADPADPPEPKEGGVKLDGAWIVESAIANGEPDDSRNGEPVVFADGKASGVGPPVPYTVDATKEPHALDLVMAPNATMPAIFKIDGATLQLCIPAGTKARPKDFDGAKGVVVISLRRAVKGELLYSRLGSQTNLTQIGLALQIYFDAYKRLPPASISDAAGKPLLSWRVAILPYLGEETAALYKEFDLAQPWDSPQNKALIAKMPQVYVVPMLEAKDGMTHYRTLVGPGTVLEPLKDKDGKLVGRSMFAIPDGTSNTIIAVEAAEPTTWTKPDDLPYDPDGPLPKFGVAPSGYNVLLTDGRPVFVRPTVTEKMLRPYFTINNGMPREPLDPKEAGKKFKASSCFAARISRQA